MLVPGLGLGSVLALAQRLGSVWVAVVAVVDSQRCQMVAAYCQRRRHLGRLVESPGWLLALRTAELLPHQRMERR